MAKRGELCNLKLIWKFSVNIGVISQKMRWSMSCI
jgi:hypothetical protein